MGFNVGIRKIKEFASKNLVVEPPVEVDNDGEKTVSMSLRLGDLFSITLAPPSLGDAWDLKKILEDKVETEEKIEIHLGGKTLVVTDEELRHFIKIAQELLGFEGEAQVPEVSENAE